MIDLMDGFRAELAAGPQWVLIWVRFLGAAMMLAIPFAFVRVEARWLVLVIVVTIPFMVWLYSIFGYQRILGLGHVILWTPYVIYLWLRRSKWRIRETISGKWLVLVFTMMVVSLVMDYSDVVRYLLGERIV